VTRGHLARKRTTRGLKADHIRTKSGPHADRIRSTGNLRASQYVPAMTFGFKSSVCATPLKYKLNTSLTGSDAMNLTPNLPPGRANRKALAFAAEINRLRTAGYSFEAIRLALLEAGLKVSRTTVKREVAKRPVTATPAPLGSVVRPSVVSQRSLAGEVVVAPTSFAGDARSGKEIAQAFMHRRVSNPLIQERNQDENRSD
jgi:hypothetical protein